MTEQEVAVQGPGQPPTRLHAAYDYLRSQGVKVPDNYDEFAAGMRQDGRMEKLYDYFKSEGVKVPDAYEEFAQGMAEVPAAEEAPVESKKKDEATGPAAGAPSPDIAFESVATPDWEAIGKWAPGPAAELATVDGNGPTRIGDDGRAQRVVELPKPEKNTERVRIPADYAGPEIPGTYQLPASTDPAARYFDRPLSKVAEGESQEQGQWEAARRTFVNGLKDMGEGGASYAGAIWRNLADAQLMEDKAAAGGKWEDLTDAERTQLAAGNLPQRLADAIEGSKQKVAPFYEKGELDLHDPGTWAVPAARNAALAVPLVLSAAFPEGKVAQVLQKVAAVGFDSQMVQGSFERAKQAGLAPGSKEYDAYALADATATMVVFKGLGKVLEAPAQAALRRALVNQTLARVAAGESFDAAFAQASRGSAALVRQVAAQSGTMATLGAANGLKTKAGERVFNAATGTQTFPEQPLGDELADIGGEALGLGIIGALGGAAGHVGGRAEAPAYDVVRPTGQKEYENVRVTDAPDKNNTVRVVGVDAQGQPVDTRVNADHLTPRVDERTYSASDQAGDQARAAGHPEGPAPRPAEAEPAAAAPAPGTGQDRPAAPAGDTQPDAAAGSDAGAGGAAARPVATPGVVEGRARPERLPDAPEESRWLHSADDQTTAAVTPEGEIHLSTEGDAEQGAAVLEEAVRQGGTRLTVDNPTDAYYLDQAGWTADEADPYTFSPPAAELTNNAAGQSAADSEEPVAQNAPATQHAPVGSFSQRGQRPVLAHLFDSEPVKKLSDIFLDLRKSVGGALHFSKRPAGQGRGSGAIPGQYDPGTKAITVRPGAIGTTAHELGHRLDDNFGLLKKATPAAQAELTDLARHGSAAPAGANAQTYAQGEGLAEYVRGLLLDPAHMRLHYPELTRLYESEVPAEARQQVEGFSNDIRRLFSRRGAVNLDMDAPAEPTLRERLFGKPTPGSGFKLGVLDKLHTWLLDDRHPIGKMYDYLLEAAGQVRPKGAADAMQQLARLAGFQSRLADQVMSGLTPLIESFTTDPQTGRVATVRLRDDGPGGTGEALTLDWLHQPFAGGTEAEVRQKLAEAGELMVAQRTLEELDNRIADRIEDVLDAGGHVDPALLAKYPQIAQRKIEVTDRATATSPRQKRTLTFEQANQENAARRGAHAQRVADTRQKRADRIDDGINRQIDRWKDLGKKAYKTWKQAGRTADADKLLDELLDEVETAERVAHISKQGNRLPMAEQERRVNEGIDRQKTHLEGRLAAAEQALADKVPGQMKARAILEVAADLEREDAVAKFSRHGKSVVKKVATLMRRAAARLNEAKSEAAANEAVAEFAQARAALTERLKGLEKLRQARLKAVRDNQSDLDTYERGVQRKLGPMLREAARRLREARAAGRTADADAMLAEIESRLNERIKGLEKLRQARRQANNERYDSKVVALRKRAAPTAVSETADGPLTGIGSDVHDDADRARSTVALYEQMKQQNPGRYQALVEGARRYRVWADANLQKAVDAGLLSREEYAAIQQRQSQYVALQRIMDAAPGEPISTFTPSQRKGIGGGKKTVYRFQGSDRAIKNPWASLLDSTARLIAEADRNSALLALREAAIDAAQAGADTSAVAREVSGQEVKGDKVKIYVNGQAEEWVFDPEVQKAMTELGKVAPLGPAGKVFAGIAAFTRSAITLNPAFVLRNLARDLGEGMIVSTSGQHRGLETAWNKQASQMAGEILHLMGGGQAGNFARTEADYHRLLDQAVTRISQDKKSVVVRLSEAPGKVWERYKALAEKGETFGRKREVLAAFKKAKAQGMSDRDAAATAAFMARDLMDFSTAGSVVRKINQFVPFTNARVQGLRRLYRTAKADPKGFALRFAAYAVAPALAELAIINASGRKEEYEQLPAYRKQGFYNLPLPGGGWLTIAKPFELGAAATLVTSLVDEHALGSERATEGQLRQLGENALVLSPDAIVGGPLKAAAEVMNNRDQFRDKAIIPEREKKLAVEYRPGTERGSRLGQAVQAATGDAIDSRNVDHLVEGLAGSTGRLVTAASDIGREDEGKGLTLGLTGAYGAGPVAHGRDIEWFNDKLAEYDLATSEPAKLLKAKLDAYYKAKGDDELQRELGVQLRELAKRLREEYPEERLRQMKYEKDHPEGGEDE